MSCHVAPIIGHHRAPLSQKFGAPRQPNLVPLTSVIEMVAPYDTPAAFVGLSDFSHIWLSWQFHHNHIKKNSAETADFRAQVRPPRLGGNQKIGVFASRSMYRPSQLGLSVVKLERVEVRQGRALLVISGADMIDGTPIIDIKPYVAYSDAQVAAVSGFAPDAPAAQRVEIHPQAREQFTHIVAQTQQKNGPSGQDNSVTALLAGMQHQLQSEDAELISALVAQDPRPAYRRAEINTPFVMRYKDVDVTFCQAQQGLLQITAIESVV